MTVHRDPPVNSGPQHGQHCHTLTCLRLHTCSWDAGFSCVLGRPAPPGSQHRMHESETGPEAESNTLHSKMTRDHLCHN